MSVLIVDDNPVSTKVVEAFLKKEGVDSVITSSGAEALKALVPGGEVDLIITDYSMPEMTGLQFVAQLKDYPGLADLPVIVMSAYADPGLIAQARGLACVDFLVKPLDRNSLLSKVKALLQKRRWLLASKHRTMERLGLKPEQYDELLSLFSQQIAQAIPIISQVEAAHESVPEPIPQLMKELAESGRILGAEKFVHVYDALTPQYKGADCHAFVLALQQVVGALTQRLPVSRPQ